MIYGYRCMNDKDSSRPSNSERKRLLCCLVCPAFNVRVHYVGNQNECSERFFSMKKKEGRKIRQHTWAIDEEDWLAG